MDKVEVARRQLGTALHLFLEDLDPVSVHCLACGGAEIAGWLAKSVSGENFSTHAEQTTGLKPLEIGKLRNQLWNAFKHATDRKGKDRDDDELFAKFRSDDNEHFLFLGWYDYGQAGFSLPVEAQVFQTWYLAKYPEKLDPSADFSTMRSFFPQLTSQPRDHQRARLTAICQRARSDNSLMSSPMTDLRPLILP